MQSPNNKQTIWNVVGLLVMLGLIVVVFVFFVDLRAVGRTLKTADFRFLLLASGFLVLGLVIYAVRWRLLLANKPGLLTTFHASNIGHMGNMLIPGRVGEGMRIVVMGASGQVTVVEATSSFVIERLFEQIMRLAALGGAVVYGVGLQVSPATVVGGLGFVALAFVGIWWMVNHQEQVLSSWPGRLAKLPRVSEAGARNGLKYLLANSSAVSQPRQLAAILSTSVLTWACFAAFFYTTLLALPEAFAAGERLAVMLGALALSPPSAATQPGLFHVSVIAPLTAVGFQTEPLTAYAVLLHILEMVWMIGLAVWGLTQTGLSLNTLWQRNKQPSTAP